MRELVEYQNAALSTAKYNPDLWHLYPALGLGGEAGEAIEKVVKSVWPGPASVENGVEAAVYNALTDLVAAAKKCEMVKKLLRDSGDDLPAHQLERMGKKVPRDGGPDREGIAKELGDTLWYLSVMAHYINFGLDEVAELNVRKLRDRRERGKLHGSGDER
jgi:NTP pyrophosphatase (non-canonical NTP hydrolase)